MNRGWKLSNRVCALSLFAISLALGQVQHSEDEGKYQFDYNGTVDPANGAAVMVAGRLWDSFLPPNVRSYYGEVDQPLIGTFLRIGNFDRAWSTPTHMWPGGWPYGMFWGKGMYLAEFNPDSTWNPFLIGGVRNPAHSVTAGGCYALGSYSSTVLGANDPQRNYSRETRWADATKRHHAIYEAGWPTNIGVDAKIRIHQFTLNWNNFNDFIIVEITLTNTGVLDVNADGVADSLQTGRPGRNKIRALALMGHGEVFGSYYLTVAGSRASRLGSARAIGYVGDPDPKGAPWDMMVAFAGESTPGMRDMGLNSFPERFYTDVWSAWSWVAVKKGSAPSELLHTLSDKLTIYGTHGIGTGRERGWYATAGHGRGLDRNGLGAGGSLRSPKLIHTAAVGTWYKDGGKLRDSSEIDLSPNPNYFASGIRGDPTSFVPKPNPSRPDGDRKLISDVIGVYAFEVESYEPGWKQGFSATNNFDGDAFSGIGSFSLDAGESMTAVWAEAGGYRLQGVQNAIAAARWAFENGYAVPEPPAAPEMMVENTLSQSLRVRWDNKAETHADFAGYKIWKVSAAKPVQWLEEGMRGLDEYWRSTTPGSTSPDLLKPINPAFAGFAFVAGRTGVADSWGPYELVAVLPKSALNSFRDAGTLGYNYSWEDNAVAVMFKYWYYVSAYTGGSYTLGQAYAGLNNPTTSTIESSNLNRNGAAGLWQDTYPFAELNSFFPKSSEGQKALGAGFTVRSALTDAKLLSSGTARIGVKPNPYKKLAFWDSRTSSVDHKIVFFNLPQKARITILDVSGQIIHQFHFESNDPQNGTLEWNLFSKNGIEVASGLYIYVVDYEGGQHIGYLSILR